LEFLLEFLSDYGLFLAKAVTLVVCLIVVLSIILSLRHREGRAEKGHIEVTKLNDRFDHMADTLKHAALEPEQLKLEAKAEKKKSKQDKAALKKALKADKNAKKKSDIKKEEDTAGDATADNTSADQETEIPAAKKRLFILNFNGDIKANATDHLREEITTVLSLASKKDEVVLRLESPGGVVHGYGLAASQLSRIKNKGVPLTVCVDKVAASGGYMMACVADKVLAAPFAILGSIGVMAELPNFNRLLKKVDIDYDVYTAGEFKRTVTTFGENTEKGKAKFKEELQEVHTLFKEFIHENRPVVDIDAVATGEAWYGRHALERKLVDELLTSDEYITEQQKQADIFEVEYVAKKSLQEKLGFNMQQALENAFLKVIERLQYSRFFS
jgi:serine protease SohB